MLDLGAGTGRFTVHLAKAFRASVVAVEPSREMRKHGVAHVRGIGACYVGARAEQLPFAPRTFDVVFASMVVHHLSDLPGCAVEIARVTAPNGFVLIRNSFRGRMDGIPYHRYFPGARAIDERRLPSIEELSNASCAAGLELIHHSVVRQKIDDTLAAHLERLRLRSLSTLALLPDAEFREGIERMEQAVREQRNDEPVFENVDLVVFTKSG